MGGRGASINNKGNSLTGDAADIVEGYVSGELMYLNQLIRNGEEMTVE